MDIKFRYLPDGPPVFDTAKARARWAAAKADYLAGGSGPEVCERHGLSLSTFRWRASNEGWRRADQPAPFIAADPPQPSPAPAAQDQTLVIPEAPQALSGTPLTAAQMVDTCWSHIQAAVAAGRVIEARSWMRLYKDLKPFARYEEIEAREARMDAAAAELREAEAAENALADEEPLVIPQAPSGAIRDEDLAPPLHCFSVPESHEPPRADDDPTGDLVRLTTRLAAVSQQVERAARDAEAGLPLDGFSDSESHPAPETDDALARLVAELQALTGHAERAVKDETVRLQLHCFSPPESHTPGPGP